MSDSRQAVFAVIVRLAMIALRELPMNGFGLCSGMPEANDDAPDEVLTSWLTQYFDQLSGQREYCASRLRAAIDLRRPAHAGTETAPTYIGNRLLGAKYRQS